MEKVYVTEGELKALNDSILTHRHKQLDLDSGKVSYVACLNSECACCVHAGLSWVKGANCEKCAIGKAGHKGCEGIGWMPVMKEVNHQAFIDNLIKIREHCVVGEKERVSLCKLQSPAEIKRAYELAPDDVRRRFLSELTKWLINELEEDTRKLSKKGGGNE